MLLNCIDLILNTQYFVYSIDTVLNILLLFKEKQRYTRLNNTRER